MKLHEPAFVATTYRVETPEGDFSLRVGQVDAGFERFLKRHDITRWGIITGFNPGARQVADEDNRRADRKLQDCLHGSGFRHFRACNIADAGDWPDEPGYFVADVAVDELLAMASELGQRAILAGRQGSAPEIIGVGEM